MIEFSINEMPNKFRYKDISPIKLLAIQSTIDFNDVNKTEQLYTFILENTQVNINGSWQDCKLHGKDVYLPIGFEKNGLAMLSICSKFMLDVLKPIFTKSEE